MEQPPPIDVKRSSTSKPPREHPPLEAYSPFIENLIKGALNEIKSKEKEFWVVKYFKSSCPGCMMFVPVFASLAEGLHTSHPKLHFGQINCEEELGVCGMNGMDDLPGVKLYYEGYSSEYTGIKLY
jgi:thiol-disulfide isomerase/thioredoxin